MKKVLLSIFFIAFNAFIINAQCVIVPSCTNSPTIGVCSYPVSNSTLTIINAGVLYNGVIQFKTDSSFVFTSGPIIPILGSTITAVTGLPSGISAFYNPINGDVPTDTYGCLSLSGITNSPVGIYTVSINFTINTPVGYNLQSIIFYLPVDTTITQPCQASASFILVSDTINIGHYTGYDSSTGNGTLSYLWDFGDGTTDNIPYPSHTYTTPGQYIVCLTVSTNTNGVTCSNTHCDSSSVFKIASGFTMSSITIKPSTTTSIKNTYDILDYVSVYPNPINNELYIDIIKSNKKYNYTLTDALGREILKGILSEKNNRIDVSSLPKSYYLLTLIDIEQQQLNTYKLIK